MKKAKIALTAVAVLAVVGGALAYKAALPRTFFINDAQGKCLVQTQYTLSIVPTTYTAQPTSNATLSIASVNAPCPVTKVITVQ